MRKLASFSGGATSAFMCKKLIEEFGKDNIDFIFMDTGAEHPKTYEFIRNVNSLFNLNLTCLRGDFSAPLGKGVNFKVVSIDDIGPDLIPFRDEMAKYGVPYIGGMHCSGRMKQRVHDKYCDATYGKGNYQTWLGIRADEPRRLTNVGKTDHIRYLAEICDYDKEDIIKWWKAQPFQLGLPEWLGNCIFCPKKSNLKLAAAQRDEPTMYAEWLTLLHSDHIRVDEKTGNRTNMYRGKQSLENLIATFDGSTGEEIKMRLRGAKHLDTGSCSESCEVFN